MKRAVILALLLMVPAISGAQPSISGVSGTVGHGNSVTLTGSSFGTKPGSTPWIWENWSSVTTGQQITTSTAVPWENPGVLDSVPTVQTNPHSGSAWSKIMRARRVNPTSNASSSAVLTGQTFSKMCLVAWQYNDTTGVTSGNPDNQKHVRWHQTGTGAPNLGWTDTGPLGGAYYAIAGDGKFNDFTLNWTGVDQTTLYNNWYHITWCLDPAGGGTTTAGKVRAYINGTLAATSDAASLLNTGYTGWTELFIGNYIRTDGWVGTIDMWWEGLYLDKSWNRIELASTSNCATASHREIQPYTAWSTGSVTVTLNRGTFQPGDSVYFCAWDDNDNNSTAFGPYTLQADGGGGGGSSSNKRLRVRIKQGEQ